MNKVGILTLNGYYNYGNRLQNYALQEAIESLNFETETILNKTYINKKNRNSFKKIIKKIKYLNNKIYKKEIDRYKDERRKAFEDFSRMYIKETNFFIEHGKINGNINDKYKFFISGSDQVWNPYDPTVSSINFMTFTSKEKRLTYAPSFGVSSIPEEYKNDYTNWLLGIDNISVREKEGANIIKELTGKKAQVVVDPTMLHTKEKWMTIAKKAINKPSGKYLLTYFLGEIPREVKRSIKKISRENKLEVVKLSDINEKKHYVTGPSEFIDYIHDASLFMTDSFHGCVFSVLLETPFIVCDRMGHTIEQNMGSRIETFVNKFELQSRKFNNVKDDEILICNYEQTNKVLDLERKKGWNYLKQILQVSDL